VSDKGVPMEYTCSICGDKVGKELLLFIDHTESHIVDEIKAKHPEWDEGGVCKKCIEYYRKQIGGRG